MVPKTAIITHFGLFEFLGMPFGLNNAGMTFQRFMDQIFNGLGFTFIAAAVDVDLLQTGAAALMKSLKGV